MLASGVIGSDRRRKPYPPILSMMAASTTEPPVGASTCASGSQVCTGHIGILTANAARKARNSSFWVGRSSPTRWKSSRLKLPVFRCR